MAHGLSPELVEQIRHDTIWPGVLRLKSPLLTDDVGA